MTSIETVTILITDLVNSTGLESRLGPAAAGRLRDEQFALVRNEVAQAGGREVKNLGDGLLVAFDSAAAALLCSVSIQQRFDRRNRSAAEPMLIKIGLSAGDATASEGDYFGIPVIEATRLCERCSGRQILARELVVHLAGVRDDKLRRVGELDLKGLPAPVATVEVGWEPLGGGGSLPLPSRLQNMPAAGFVGRTAEHARLERLLEEASDSALRLALISGEPGIGKTRLCTRVALEARSRGTVVLYGRGEQELAVPYGPWVEALGHYVDRGPEPILREHVARHGGELERLVPQLRARVPDAPAPRETDPDTERYLLWGAVVGLLGAASETEPLLLVLDDLHWADKPTLLLLRYVVAQGHGLRVLILGAYRESDLAPGHPLGDALAELRREQGLERIALSGLDREDIVELLERAAGHDLDTAAIALSDELFQETDGNPFYTGELLRHLRESGAIYVGATGRWSVRSGLSEGGLPQSVREVLGQRVARLGPSTGKVLAAAAVIGTEFDLDLLAAVTGEDEDELLELLEAAAAAAVLHESGGVPGRFAFAHALINHTLYEALGATRRARLHRRVGEALEGSIGAEPGARVAELAHHWSKAGADKAVRYARLAGERALAELAPDEALRWFDEALELQGDSDGLERCDILIGLGEAQRQVGDAAFRETLLDAAEAAFALEDPERAARAALANNRGEVSAFGQVDEQRLRVLERALELDDATDPARRAQLISLRTVELQYDPDHKRRRELAAEALELARQTGDARTLGQVLRDYIWAVWAPDTLAQRAELTDELIASAREAHDPALEFWGVIQEVNVLVESGELDRALASVRRDGEIADALGQPALQWFASYQNACFASLAENLTDVDHQVERAFQIGTAAGQPDAVMIYGAQLAMLRTIQGRSGEIIALLEQGVEANPRIPAWRAGLAFGYCWLGRIDEATAIVRAAAIDRFDHVRWDQVRLTALALYADAAAQAGVRDAAAVLYELLEPWRDQVVWDGATCWGHVRTFLGLLAATLRLDEQADEHFAIAYEEQERSGLLRGAARARLGLAEALAGRGEPERARPHAERALELARARDYGAIETRAVALAVTARRQAAANHSGT